MRRIELLSTPCLDTVIRSGCFTKFLLSSTGKQESRLASSSELHAEPLSTELCRRFQTSEPHLIPRPLRAPLRSGLGYDWTAALARLRVKKNNVLLCCCAPAQRGVAWRGQCAQLFEWEKRREGKGKPGWAGSRDDGLGEGHTELRTRTDRAITTRACEFLAGALLLGTLLEFVLLLIQSVRGRCFCLSLPPPPALSALLFLSHSLFACAGP